MLGVWHNGKGNKKHQENLIHTITDQTSYILKKKTITDKQLRYIINHVYIPKITYLLNDMILSSNTCNKINSKISKVIKHKLGLANTTPNNAIFNPLEYGFCNIWDRQIIHHGTNWNHRINLSNHAGKLIQI